MDTGELPTQFMIRSQHPEAVRSSGYPSDNTLQRMISPQRSNGIVPINFDDPTPLPPATAYFGGPGSSYPRKSLDAGVPKYISDKRGAADDEPPRPVMLEDLAMMQE